MAGTALAAGVPRMQMGVIHDFENCRFKRLQTLGEQLLFGTWLTGSDGKLTLERRFQIVRPADGATILRGRWNLVCIEMSSGRPRRMPPEFLEVYLGALI